MTPPDTTFAEAVCAALRAQAARAGVSLGDEPLWAAATLDTRTDPFSHETSLVATWSGGARYGSATFLADGRVFAEYQVLQAHPARPGHYVEAVQVWGTPGALRGDVVVAPLPA